MCVYLSNMSLVSFNSLMVMTSFSVNPHAWREEHFYTLWCSFCKYCCELFCVCAATWSASAFSSSASMYQDSGRSDPASTSALIQLSCCSSSSSDRLCFSDTLETQHRVSKSTTNKSCICIQQRKKTNSQSINQNVKHYLITTFQFRHSLLSLQIQYQ